MTPTRTYLRTLAAFALSEMMQKLSRLIVVIVAARLLEAEALGIAAAALAAGDILKSLTEVGIVQRIVAAPAERLAGLIVTAKRLFWTWCLGLFAAQCVLAFGIWACTGSAMIPVSIALLGLEYLVMPAGIINYA